MSLNHYHILTNKTCWWTKNIFFNTMGSCVVQLRQQRMVASVTLWNAVDEVGQVARDDSRFAPSQQETALLCNTVSHWLGASLELALVASTNQALHWRHNDHDDVSNHQPHGCLLNCLFRRRSKKTSKLCITDLCAGNSLGPVNSPHKGPVEQKMFPFDDVIMVGFHNIITAREDASVA